jgi:S1-C subfamily serine protease
MKEKNTIKILAVLVIILIVSQAFIIYFVLIKANESLNAINALETNLNQKITINVEDTQSKINTLTDKINALSTTQSDIQSQISKIKATTSADFSGIIEQDIKGVVTIKTSVAQGTGFLLTNNGYIVTNAHVLSGGRYANAYTYDGNRYSADLIGYDSKIDLALLKIDGDFTKLTLGNSDNVKIGEKVIAIGNPLGLSFTATEGIISARDRTGSNNLPYYFQTDVSLNPGNSGGPLIDTAGEVIGINNFKISGAENIGFALESKYIKQTINKIAAANNQTLTI